MTKLNSMRRLDRLGIAYTVHTFPDTLHSADAVAEHLGIAPGAVFKTIVALGERGKPLLVMAPGDRQVDTKALARAVGAKSLGVASHAEAERLTGLLTGGISPLAVPPAKFAVYIDASAGAAPGGRIVVSAGRRGVNLELAVADLVRATGAKVVEATG